MAEEVKPIKTERIDNPDGTYTIKEVYKNNTAIINYDTQDRLLSNYWYKEEDCINLLGKRNRKYDTTGNYIDYVVHSYPLEKNQLSEIIIYNDKNQIEQYKIFSDKEFCNTIASANFEYEENGNYIQYSVYDVPQERNGYLSTITKFNVKQITYTLKSYYDKEFKNICATEYREYNKYRTKYKSKTSYENVQFDSFFSTIQYVNILKNYKKTFYFYSKNYKNLKWCMIEYNKKQYKFKGILAHILFWLAH